MHPNLLFIPTFFIALGLGWLGLKAASKGGSFVSTAAAMVLALPALLYVAYYGHFLDNAAWFYTLRAAPFSELLASGLGFGIGLLLEWLRRSTLRNVLTPLVMVVGFAILFVPYAKPFLSPQRAPLQNHWSNGVLLQSTPSTCGPCSAATLLRQFGIAATERELACECFTYGGGTENWYVARAIRRRGLLTNYQITAPQPGNLPMPCIAGVKFSAAGLGGHFITLLDRSGDNYIVGDPLVGKLVLSPEKLRARYYFTGFFLVVSKPQF